MEKNIIILIVFIVAIIVVVGIKVIGDIIMTAQKQKNDVSKIKFKLKMNQDEKVEEAANPFDFANIDNAVKKTKNTDDVPDLFGNNNATLKEETKATMKETLSDSVITTKNELEDDVPRLDFSKRVSVSRMARSEMDIDNQEKKEENIQ